MAWVMQLPSPGRRRSLTNFRAGDRNIAEQLCGPCCSDSRCPLLQPGVLIEGEPTHANSSACDDSSDYEGM